MSFNLIPVFQIYFKITRTLITIGLVFYPNTYGGRVANLHHNELKIVYWYIPTALGFEKTESSASGFKKKLLIRKSVRPKPLGLMNLVFTNLGRSK